MRARAHPHLGDETRRARSCRADSANAYSSFARLPSEFADIEIAQIDIASAIPISLNLEIIDFGTAEQEFSEILNAWRQAIEFVDRHDDGMRLSMLGDDLRPFMISGVNQFAELRFRLLNLPRCHRRSPCSDHRLSWSDQNKIAQFGAIVPARIDSRFVGGTLENICSIAHHTHMMIAGGMAEAVDQDQAIPGRREIDAAGRALARMTQRNLLRWAAVARADGDLASARRLVDLVRSQHGESVGWMEEAARLSFSEGQFDEAEALLRKRSTRHPSATAEVALGRYLLDRKRFPEAEAIAASLIGAYPDHITVTMFAADLARAQG